MNRKTAARKPQRRAYGTPIRKRPTPGHKPNGAIRDCLHEQVAADTLAGIVQGLGRRRQPAIANEPDQSVADIFTPNEHKDHEYNDETGGREQFQNTGERREE
jgi:hypothetical protein